MWTEQDKKFINEWAKIRAQKKTHIYFVKGLRNALIFMSLIILSLTTGWYKRIPFLSVGLMMTILVGIFLILICSGLFYSQYIYENNEQRYLELLAKNKNNPS